MANGANSVLEKLRPEVGAPTKAGRALGGASCGRRAPRRMAPARCPKSFAPGRASHKAGRALGAVSCGRRDPRRMAPTRCWRSFAPRSGLPQSGACAGCCFLWEARPVANGASSVPEKLRPEVGAPTKAGRALGGASYGRRDPRRMAPARCPKSFARKVGLLRLSAPPGSRHRSAPVGRWACAGAG